MHQFMAHGPYLFFQAKPIADHKPPFFQRIWANWQSCHEGCYIGEKIGLL